MNENKPINPGPWYAWLAIAFMFAMLCSTILVLAKGWPQ